LAHVRAFAGTGFVIYQACAKNNLGLNRLISSAVETTGDLSRPPSVSLVFSHGNFRPEKISSERAIPNKTEVAV
jgi:hypothetical protein